MHNDSTSAGNFVLVELSTDSEGMPPERDRYVESRAHALLLAEGWILCDEGRGDWTAEPPSAQQWAET